MGNWGTRPPIIELTARLKLLILRLEKLNLMDKQQRMEALIKAQIEK